MLNREGKRGQLSIYIIAAIVIVAVLVGWFFLRRGGVIGEIPAEFKPLEETFLSCVEDYGLIGANILGDRGGYIYPPDFVPGTEYMPTSNYLDFKGIGVPYWYYVSGNGVREQVPSKSDMEEQLETFIDENFECDFSDFRERGFIVNMGEINSDVKILDDRIDVSVNSDLEASFENESIRVQKHEKEVKSNLGKFYSAALKVYSKEKQEAFLEAYGVDVLRLYAPVDGVEMSCSPKIWMKQDIDEELKEALEANVQAIRVGAEKNEYFVQALNAGENVDFLYDRKWPTKIEVWDSVNDVLIAEPVGNQPGLGILGFCYVPYHFVYDIVYPVLIQVYDNTEMFQFPVAVIIEGNVPREALEGGAVLNSEPELCKYKDVKINVHTYDIQLEPVEAEITFECVRQSCDIGKTEATGGDSFLAGEFPRCVNGIISAEAEGYARKSKMISTNLGGEADMVLDKLYPLDIELKVDSKETGELAVVSFVSENNVQTVAWPEQKSVSLSEGQYNISVYVYRSSSIKIPAMKKEQCTEVPKSGLLGVFGMTEEKCFNIDLPSQTLENAMMGGGKSAEYIIESQLKKGKVEINVESLPLPTSLEQLQDNYNLVEVKPVYLSF
ncbi:MAG: hypothetical protein AABX71_02895 [Nanoarchaeota archaeon]